MQFGNDFFNYWSPVGSVLSEKGMAILMYYIELADNALRYD